MLRPLPGNWHTKNFTRGTNSDIDPNKVAQADGVYTDSFNMRNTSSTGNAGALVQLRGETLFYIGTAAGAETYHCIGAVSIHGHLVSFWASSAPLLYPPIIQIDGIDSAMSFDIPYTYERKLQFAGQLGCKSGIIFTVDGNTPCLYWDVQAMIDAQGTPLFFGGFSLELQTVGLAAAPLIPVVNEVNPLQDLGGPVGLGVGLYSYSGRYVTATGNATNWGPESGAVDIPAQYQQNSYNLNAGPFTPPSQLFPGGQTIGGFANPLVPTNYGINLRMYCDNQFGYAYIEIKRRRINQGAGLTDQGTEEVIAKIPITQGQMNIIDFCDPVNAIPAEAVAPQDADDQTILPQRPHAVEYANGRLSLAHYDLLAEPDLNFITVDGSEMTSITKKMVRRSNGVEVPDGFDNPYNQTYYKSAKRGEEYSYGVQCWNNTFGLFFAVDIPGLESYRHPNRRDIKGPNGNWGQKSLDYSDDPIWAANINCNNLIPNEGPVGATFEVFTQGDMAKTDVNSVINPSLPHGITAGASVGRIADQFMLFSSDPQQGVVIPVFNPVGNYVFVIPNPDGGYQPWRPVNNQDNHSGWNIPSVVAKGLVGLQGGVSPSPADFFPEHTNGSPQNSRGRVHSPTYHSLGGLIHGITGVDDSISVLSIVRTPPAGRVVAQGLFTWDLIGQPDLSIDNGMALKSTNSGITVFPDYDNGIADAATFLDAEHNPGNYYFQFVSPLGAYFEVYNYAGSVFGPGDPTAPVPVIATNGAVVAYNMDILTHVRVLEDHGQVNVGEPPAGNMGYQPVVGNTAPWGNYIGHAKWRSHDDMTGAPVLGNPTYSFWHESPDQGNALLELASLTFHTENRTSFFNARMSQYTYSPPTNSTHGSYDFNSIDTRRFHQPMYVVNLLREGAHVPQANSQQYVNTAVHIPRVQCIGIYSGGQQDFELLRNAVRWEDCVNFMGDEYRYTYLLTPASGEQRFLNITGNTVINLAAILADIAAQGFWIAPDGLKVYGVYEQVFDANGVRFLRFGNPAYNTPPVVGSRIRVKSDFKNIRVFGHDNVIGPTVHAVMDKRARRPWIASDPPPVDKALYIRGLPLVHPGFMLNPRYFMPDKGSQTEEQIMVNYLMSIRQWVMLWDVESTNPSTVYVNANSVPGQRLDTQQFFPAMHNVMRPTKFDGDMSYAGLFPSFAQDYPDEYAIFDLGGLRFRPAVNLDYAHQWAPGFVGKPKAGYDFNTNRCTSMIASEVFSPNLQNTPNFRTFRAANEHTLSEETGPISAIRSATGGDIGQAMFWWTYDGYGYTLTNKHVLSGADGSDVTTQAIANYWGQDVLLSRGIGLPPEYYRTLIRAAAPVDAAGADLVDTFFWATPNEVYRMVAGEKARAIGVDHWLKKLLPQLQTISPTFNENVTATYDPVHHEYLLAIIKNGITRYGQRYPFVYAAKRHEWGGSYGHLFDAYAAHDGSMYGFRALNTFKLDDTGAIQNELPIEAFGEAPFAPEQGVRYQAQSFRAYPDKPTRIELYDKNHNLIWYTDFDYQESLDPGSGQWYVLEVDGWEQLVGRTNLDLGLGDMPQQELFYLRFIYKGQEQMVLSNAQLQLHRLV